MVFALLQHDLRAQYISLNGAYFSISGSTTFSADTINNNSSSTVANAGTLTLNTLTNAGTSQGNGVYNIAKGLDNTGTFTAGTSIVNYNGSGNQTIAGLAYYNLALSNGNTKTLGGAVSIIDSLSLGASTTLALSSYDFTLKSTATEVARIANTPSSANITYGTGRFIAERYVMGRRKYRLMTSSVTSSPNATLTTGEEALSIWGNWQNSANNTTPNVGTLITGGTLADGFDQGTTNASIYDYDDINKRFVAHSTANGKNTKYTPLKAGIAYYLFVYGDRLNTVNATSPHNTVLPSKGKVLMGDQTYSTSSTIPLTGVTNRFTMLGNPFASPIDWATISRNNISNTFWGWDPNLNSTGGYVTVSSTGTVTLVSPFSGSVGLNQYIQPGQGFFVKTTGASPTMTIHESDKVSNFNGIAFRNGRTTNNTTVNNIPLIAVNLQYLSAGNMILADGTLAAFDPSFSNSVGNEDGTKIAGAAEVVAVQNGTDLLGIEARQMPADLDTIFLNLNRITKPQYTLQIFTNQMAGSGRQPYLVDNYLSTTQSISLTDTTTVVFNVTSGVPASSAANRFSIVFKDISVLPINFISINAIQKGKDVEVDWSVVEDVNTRKYEVERSSNGISFLKVGEVTAKGINSTTSYLWLDHQPMSGKNFYRVRGINADGRYLMSKIAWVNIDATTPSVESSIKVYPNPVIGQQFNLQLNDLPKGTYTLQLINTQDQVVLTQSFAHNGVNGSASIPIKNYLPSGYYYLQLNNDKNLFTQKIYRK